MLNNLNMMRRRLLIALFTLLPGCASRSDESDLPGRPPATVTNRQSSATIVNKASLAQPDPLPARQPPVPQGVYAYYHWPTPQRGMYNVDSWLTIEAIDPSTRYFWAHQFTLRGGHVGYLGLQSMGSGPHSPGKIAIFSIWNASAAKGPHCVAFGGEGTGLSCRVAFDWQIGRTYRLRLWAVDRDGHGQWWGAWVQDTQSQTETFIGQIRAPSQAGWLADWSVNWTEYFGGPLQSCASQPYARARWGPPLADNGSLRPSHTSNVLASTSCQNGHITESDSSTTQEMGRPSAR